MGQAPAETWGIAPGFHGTDGAWRTPSPETLSALLAAMEAGGESPPGADRLPLVIDAGTAAAVPEPELTLEDGRRLRLQGVLPADLPLGYHQLSGPAGERRLVVAPARCWLPDDLFGWGLAVQLYAVTSRASLGMGDLADLAELGRWSRELGACMLLLNPIHAALPGVPQEPSPYYPSSRRFLNPLYLRVEDVPAVAARRARRGELIDRDAVYEAKMGALEAAWIAERERAGRILSTFRAARPGLEEYATFCALAELHGRPWQRWPPELRHPTSPAVARLARERRDRVHFHEWLQWRLEDQLKAAGRECGIVSDVAVGVHPDGADAWAWQDVLAKGVSVGAPPDTFNRAGQDWGLPPFDPWRLAQAGYEPFIQTVRASLRHAAGIRVDHVMGLFRLYWIPIGMSPGHGAYVHYPSRELLSILALESVRARAYVIGEDLGTVQDEVRHDLYERAVLSYRLLWFEPGAVEHYPRQALAALSTHDLPTLMGVWTEADPMPEVKRHLIEQAGLSPEAGDDEVIEKAYRLLAHAPSRLLAPTLDDIAGARERPNRPGTTAASNWSTRLPMTIEQLRRSRRLRALAPVLARQ